MNEDRSPLASRWVWAGGVLSLGMWLAVTVSAALWWMRT